MDSRFRLRSDRSLNDLPNRCRSHLERLSSTMALSGLFLICGNQFDDVNNEFLDNDNLLSANTKIVSFDGSRRISSVVRSLILEKAAELKTDPDSLTARFSSVKGGKGINFEIVRKPTTAFKQLIFVNGGVLALNDKHKRAVEFGKMSLSKDQAIQLKEHLRKILRRVFKPDHDHAEFDIIVWGAGADLKVEVISRKFPSTSNKALLLNCPLNQRPSSQPMPALQVSDVDNLRNPPTEDSIYENVPINRQQTEPLYENIGLPPLPDRSTKPQSSPPPPDRSTKPQPSPQTKSTPHIKSTPNAKSTPKSTFNKKRLPGVLGVCPVM